MFSDLSRSISREFDNHSALVARYLKTCLMNSGSDKTVRVILGLWFCLALIVGMSGRFHVVSAPIVAATVWTLTGLALFLCWILPAIRRWVAIVDLRWLIALHLARFVGFYFLFLYQRDQLPEGFAVPAGIGDIVVAFTAGMILIVPKLRDSGTVVFLWNAFGLIDIVFVAFSALRFGLKDWQSMAPLRELPLSLLPTFLVPLIIVSHVLIFVRLARRDNIPSN
jgi:hypothetical protein